MPEAHSLAPQKRGLGLFTFLSRTRDNLRTRIPTPVDAALAAFSALLLIFAFPNFDLWPLAWFGLVPLTFVVVRAPESGTRSFILGWITGTLFFYGSCYWLTYAAIRYGQVPTLVSYLALLPAAAIGGLFPAIFALILARLTSRVGLRALIAVPFLWIALEWCRLGVTGQLWNAIAYSQAFVPSLIQSASWGGVYGVGFLIVAFNSALTFFLIKRTRKALGIVAATFVCIGLIVGWQNFTKREPYTNSDNHIYTFVVAVQPNVPMEPVGSLEESDALLARHLSMSKSALGAIDNPYNKRVVIWPESPMNFMYSGDTQFRELLAAFTKANRTSVIFNAMEPAPANGTYNSAIMVNEEGRLIAQYDKIRLLPFGEYVPLPRWLPGAGLVPVMVGTFTPGTEYPLLPLGEDRAGIFICFEAAFPSIARRFANDGADVLINISNDGYLGPTPVLKQHLANAVFRAVENNRPLVRVTNTGITALISPRGKVGDATESYTTAVRTWTIQHVARDKTFYTKHGDVFVVISAALSLIAIFASSPIGGKLRDLIINVKG